MANTTLNTVIVLRNDTQPNWANTSVKLLKGEMAVEFQVTNGAISGQPKLKVGDGTSTYANLPYVGIDYTEINQMISTAVGAVNDRIDVLTNGANSAFDTLKEIGDYLIEHQDEYTALLTALGNKVDKVPGKGLSTNDYTNDEKSKLAGIEAGAQVNTVTGVKGDSESTYRVGNINITKANIGLGNVDNTADVNKDVRSAETLKTKRTIDGVEFNGSANIVHFGVSQTAATAGEKLVSCTGYKLETGAWMAVKFDKTNSAAVSGLQLNVNSTGAKAIKYRGGNLPAPATLSANRTYLFVYDGTNYDLIGDLDTTYTALKNPKELKIKVNGAEKIAYLGDVEKEIDFASGSANGTIQVGGEDVAVTGLKALAYKASLSKSDVGLGNVDNTADANKEVKSAGKLTTAKGIDGVDFDGQDNITHYGVCGDTAAEANKTVSIANFKLVTGASVFVKFTNTNSAAVGDLTLNVSSTGAKPIKRYGTTAINTASAIYAGMVIHFIYDGTNWLWAGHMDTNSDTYDRERYNATIAASSEIISGAIAVGINKAYHPLNNGEAFDITYPILYSTSKITAGSTSTGGYLTYSFAVSYTQAMTLTSYLPVYIKGNLSGTTFTPVSTTPLTQDVPTSADGYEYILLGVAYNSTTIRLLHTHPIYAFIGGSFGPISGNAISDISASGRTVTYTRQDGTTDTFTTQDTTYNIATTSDAGLVKSATGTNQVTVASSGVMTLASCSTDKFVQGVNTLIINGGTAS